LNLKSYINYFSNQLRILGSHITNEGKARIIAITKQSIKRYGTLARKISPMVVSAGATPFKTNKIMPNGGDFSAITMLMTIIIPNNNGSKPTPLTIGIKIGIVIIIIEIEPMNVPRKNSRSWLAMMRIMGGSGRFITNSVIPLLAPEKARSWLKVTDDVTIINIITVILRVLVKDLLNISQPNRL